MKKMVCLTLLLHFAAACAGDIQPARVTNILSGPAYGNNVLLNLDPNPDQQNCSTSTTHDYVFDVNSRAGEALLSMALAVYFSGETVSVSGSGGCTLVNNVEDLRYFQLSKTVQVPAGPDESVLASWIQSHEFISSGTFVIPDSVTRVLVAAIGGGGGGGGGYNSNTGGGGAGGGGAGYVVSVMDATPGEVVVVTIGSGGGGGRPSFTAGGNGGATSFGTYLTATGGTGGAPGRNGAGSSYSGSGAAGGGNGGASGQSGSPAVSSILDVDYSLSSTAAAGTNGDFNTGGGGGTSPFGIGGKGGRIGGGGNTPVPGAYGAGGGGGSGRDGSGNSASGAAGRSGYLKIYWY